MLCDPGLYNLRRGTSEFEAFAAALLQEARLLHSLRHQNIVQLRGVTMHPEHGHVHWMVMERANGGSLEAWVAARGRITLEELLDLLRSVMRGLVYLHGRLPAVLHRDIKPANVLVFDVFGGGIVWKLGDVGIAKVLQETLHAHTGAGTVMYMAADVLLGPYDGRVDVFSTGIMAAELVVRYMDIPGFERVAATQYRYPEQRQSLVDDACARLDSVCPALSAVVRRCSAMMARDRWTSAEALLALLDVNVGGGGGGGGVAVGQHLADMRGEQSRVVSTPGVLSYCNGVAVSCDGSTLLVSDYGGGSHAIHTYNVADGAPVRVIGGAGDGPLQFQRPCQLCIAPDGAAFVADWDNNRVQVLTPQLDFHSVVGAGRLHRPAGVCANGAVVVASEGDTHRVTVFNRGDGAVARTFGSHGSGDGELDYPQGLCFMSGGRRVAVADNHNNRVSVFSVEDGSFIRHIGAGVLECPVGVACSVADELVVTDDRSRVVVFNACGEVVKTLDGGRFTGVALVGGTSIVVQDFDRQECVVFT
jgi:sugar lactone lactonase YvrE